MVIKVHKSSSSELHNSPTFHFTNIEDLCFYFLGCESSFESYSPNIFALCFDNTSALEEGNSEAVSVSSPL